MPCTYIGIRTDSNSFVFVCKCKKNKNKTKAVNVKDAREHKQRKGKVKEKKAAMRTSRVLRRVYCLHVAFGVVLLKVRSFYLRLSQFRIFWLEEFVIVSRRSGIVGKIDKFNYGYKPNDMILIASTEFHFDYHVPDPWHFSLPMLMVK